MSKRELKKYLKTLKKKYLEEQLIDLYARFKDVKVYYDFIFNPKEDKLLEACKIKISNEYFPLSGRKAKARRSVAQKYIKHFLTLGVEPSIISDVMLYNIEIAQTYSAQKNKIHDSFYKSMLNSFEQAIYYIKQESLFDNFKTRINTIVEEIENQNWPNKSTFNFVMNS